MQVSKKLGLKPIEKSMSRSQRKAMYAERIKQLHRLLKKGGMSPKLTQRCEEYIRSSEFKIRQIALKKSTPRATKTAKGTASAQLMLPGFLSQQQVVHLAELIANRQVKKSDVQRAVSQAVKKVIKGA